MAVYVPRRTQHHHLIVQARAIDGDESIAQQNDMFTPMAVRQWRVDGAATRRMLLKRHRRRLRCRLGHFR